MDCLLDEQTKTQVMERVSCDFEVRKKIARQIYENSRDIDDFFVNYQRGWSVLFFGKVGWRIFLKGNKGNSQNNATLIFCLEQFKKIKQRNLPKVNKSWQLFWFMAFFVFFVYKKFF